MTTSGFVFALFVLGFFLLFVVLAVISWSKKMDNKDITAVAVSNSLPLQTIHLNDSDVKAISATLPSDHVPFPRPGDEILFGGKIFKIILVIEDPNKPMITVEATE